MNTARQGLSQLGVEGPNQMPTLPDEAYQNANPNAQFMRGGMEGRGLPAPVEGMGLPTPVGGGMGAAMQPRVQRPMQPQRPMRPRMGRRQMMQQRMRDPRFRQMMMRNRRRRPMMGGGLRGLGNQMRGNPMRGGYGRFR